MCHNKTLSQRGPVVISRCSECQMLFIWNRSVMLTFTPEHFSQFRDFVQELEFDSRSFSFTDEEERMVMHTPVDNVHLTFTLAEWEHFKEAMDEALYMQQVFSLMEGN